MGCAGASDGACDEACGGASLGARCWTTDVADGYRRKHQIKVSH